MRGKCYVSWRTGRSECIIELCYSFYRVQIAVDLAVRPLQEVTVVYCGFMEIVLKVLLDELKFKVSLLTRLFHCSFIGGISMNAMNDFYFI